MNKPTPEELLLQILSTVLLINTQGRWHAFLNVCGHVGVAYVYLHPSDHDYEAAAGKPSDNPQKDAKFTATNRHPWPVAKDEARQNLIDLLAWTQGYLTMEAAA
ncbi:MAG: hypothetical protein ACQZ2J_30320 [Pseudomonas piscis]|uniref:hypothetical protein n=1 Tax=Pseudomonas piscis TaxID=2614538 RepID=UPI003D2D896B